MPGYFVVTRGLRGPVGSVYYDRPPNLIGTGEKQPKRLGDSDAQLIYGPQEIPTVLQGAPIDTLMAAWRAERRKATRGGGSAT